MSEADRWSARRERDQNLFKSIMSIASDAVIAADEMGHVVFWNQGAAKLLGYEADDILGMPLREIIPMGMREAHHAGFGRAMATGELRLEGKPVEVSAIRRDGTEVPVELTVTVSRSERGFIAAAILRDITERRNSQRKVLEAMEAANAANATKSAFLANMSHELRTPMNAIIGYTEMLRELAEEVEQPDFIPDLDKIHAAAKHLLSLINDVLDLSKIEAGKMELYLEETELRKLVEDVVVTVQPLIAKNSNELVVEAGDGLGMVVTDVTRLRQVLLNLLSNASKFTHSGRITLRVAREPHPEGDRVRLAVTDTGIGMTAGQLGKLFQVFQQADASTTRKFGGTGLGLAISRRVAQMMGGDVSVESIEGKGSTFTLCLPARVTKTAEPAAAESGHSTDKAAVQLGRGNGRTPVLVIDDDPVVHDMLGRLLEGEGFEILSARTGQEGLELARSAQPAVITLDVMMPGMDGWSVLQELKASPATASIPVVMLTFDESKEMGFSLGASDYLTKPIDRGCLVRTVQRYTERSQSRPVLVVDDEPNVREVMLRTLIKEGWDVTTASNGREALDMVEANEPSLVLLDLLMPEMDGFEFVRKFREKEQWRNIPIVVVTAMDLSDEDRARLNGYVEQVVQKGNLDRESLARGACNLVARYATKAENRRSSVA